MNIINKIIIVTNTNHPNQTIFLIKLTIVISKIKINLRLEVLILFLIVNCLAEINKEIINNKQILKALLITIINKEKRELIKYPILLRQYDL